MADVYRKSNFCTSGSCVEVSSDGRTLRIRSRGGRLLRVGAPGAWPLLLSCVKDGRWDRARGGGSPV
ncbi:hypothetical protein [Alloactinosynnema sp. L-07]|uniref:hypothetical protein n=1 Tax=Alloactinosynnema sp. L-07 TaxID=1653480 RepID=UPI0006B5F29A|nr:hypothetical protein [Alloactinosynnema sp. L-07]